MRTFFLAVILILATAASVGSEATPKELAGKASDELRLLNSFQTLERITSQLNHIVTYAIVAERGGWGVLEFVETTDYKNSYVVRSTGEDLQLELVRATSAIAKNKSASEEDLSSSEETKKHLSVLIEMTPKIADLIASGQLDEASRIYKANGQNAYEDALRNSQSAVGMLQKRLGKTLLQIRIAK